MAAWVCVLVVSPLPAAEAQTAGGVQSAWAGAAIGDRPAGRLVELEDAVREVRVADLQLSPDGRTAVYVRREMDLEADRWRSAIWSVPVDGSAAPRRLTTSERGERSPRWSPDGRHLAFLSNREGPGEGSQIWVLPVEGGEAFQATALDRSVSSFAWGPAGDRFAVVLQDAREDPPPLLGDGDAGDRDGPRPYVITRLQFLSDGAGYVGERRSRIHVVAFDESAEPATEARQLTSGPYDDGQPSWSPDGRWIAFSSNRTEWPDITYQTDLWLVPAEGGELVRLTDDPGSDGGPVWSPDGGMIAFRHTPAEPPVYGSARLRTVELVGGEGGPRAGRVFELTDPIDRPVQGAPRWSEDGEHLYVVIQDRGTEPLIRVPARGGPVEQVLAGSLVVGPFALLPGGREVVAIAGWAANPGDVVVAPVEAAPIAAGPGSGSGPAHGEAGADALRNLTGVNESWLSEVRLSEPRPVRYPSRDGTPIEGWYLLPPGAAEQDGPFPLILTIHGGPVAQYTWGYSFERQWWAAQGYVVLYTNPRGSSGYGEAFAHALWQDWGGIDYEDVMAGVDQLVDRGIADPARMGVHGWSYGGLLTNFIIVRNARFRAAISGASTGLNVSVYGTDDLQRWWEHELGLPWENRQLYDRLSSLLRADRVGTPTLFVVGERDRRTPTSQSEQFYTWLRRREVPTGLIVYPDQNHGISRPSFVIDRYERYRRWYERHLHGKDDADPFFGRLAW